MARETRSSREVTRYKTIFWCSCPVLFPGQERREGKREKVKSVYVVIYQQEFLWWWVHESEKNGQQKKGVSEFTDWQIEQWSLRVMEGLWELESMEWILCDGKLLNSRFSAWFESIMAMF
jgi:hypothetical protein